jgi:arginyl-tRNA synthetase
VRRVVTLGITKGSFVRANQQFVIPRRPLISIFIATYTTPSRKVMTEFQKAIAQQVAVLSGLTEEQVIQCVEEPKNLAKADLAIPVAKLNKFKKLAGNPAQIAAEWKDKITPNHYIISASSEGPYLNFVTNKAIIVEQVIKRVFAAGNSWGDTPSIGEGKTVIVEYSSPNIAKPFHAGHLRSTIIGNFLKNLHKMLGYKTIAINYLGDWGKQYGLLAIGFEKYGSDELLEKDPIKHLFDVYVKISADAAADDNINEQARAYFKRMEDGDENALALWKKFRELSIAEYKRVYARLNVEFDVYSGESQQGEGMIRAMKELEEKNLLFEDRGAKLVNLEAHKLPKVLVQKSDGATLYITRDIAAATTRYEQYKFDQMIYVVAAQQDLHFQQLFKIQEMMGKEFADKVKHINFGMVKGMSTRKGNVVFLSDILQGAKEAMLDVMKANPEKFAEIEDPEETAYIVGLSAVVVQDLSAKRIKDYDFSWDRVCSFEGDTGPYLQYQHARLHSMARKTGVRVTQDIDYSLLSEPIAQDIARMVGKFPDVVVQAKHTLEPVTIITYLFDLAHLVSQAHSVLWVKNRETNIAEARMALFWAARVTLGNGLRLIGLVPLERM